jgi:Cys-tRNA(Pro)/Cys-tRNA(Cys) deacylase
MTPAIALLKKKGIAHRIYTYVHDPASPAYGLEAAEKLGLPVACVFKTLIVTLEGQEKGVALVPVHQTLNLKELARVAGVRKVGMASHADAERVTGYVVGGISPLGQKKRLRTFIDHSVQALDPVFVSAGRRGLEVALSPCDLQSLTDAVVAAIAQAD